MMLLTFNITDGITFQFISISFQKIVTGHRKEVNPLDCYFAFSILLVISDLPKNQM
ncbi:hypothetical protein J4G08_17875 [Candidatus Poribacteria bacterium]|nr:hypothetical protein [Candidatus Poribacteria bacterium]